MVNELTPFKERIMRLAHVLDFIPLVSVYASTGVGKFYVKEAFDTSLTENSDQVVVDSCPKE